MNLAASIQERVKGLLPDLLGIEFTDVSSRQGGRPAGGAQGSVHAGGQPARRGAGWYPRGRRVGAGAQGRTTVVCQTTIRSEAGKLVALVTQTQLVIAA